jgi:hypothetical protein
MRRILQPLFTGLLCAVLSLSALSGAHAQFTYTFYPNDATINTAVNTDFAIVGFAGGSYDENDFSRHFTGPSSPTVQVVAGANILNEMDIFNSSVVHVSGGVVSGLFPYDNSTLNIFGGSAGFVLNNDAATINVTGGAVDDLEGQGKQINVSGGTMGTLVANGSTDYLGNPLGSCIVNITGGTVTGDISAFNEGILNFYGGTFGGTLRAAEGGTINIYGSGLVSSLLNPNAGNGYSLYALSGMLEDGTVLTHADLRVRNDGVTYGHSSFNLINATPEPGGLALLLGSGACSISVLRIRRKRRMKSLQAFTQS